jgi:hypothetical protein
MAGDWIKMRKTLPTDPRIVRIMSALKADRFRTLGGVLSAWCLFDDQTEDGQLDGYTPEVFDEVVGFPGLAKAMASVGWLEIGENYLKAPRFSEHNGFSAKRRAQESVRKMSAREADKKRTKSGPEKRREEKSITHTHPAKSDLVIPKELAAIWAKWTEYVMQSQGRTIGDIEAETCLIDLLGRGIEKATADVNFSIRKTSKAILDSSNDFERITAEKRGGKPTVREVAF